MARYIDVDKLEVVSIDITDLPADHGLMCYFAEDVDNAPTEDVIPIPEGATNGDMIKAMFPSIDYHCLDTYEFRKVQFNLDWWNAPYKRGDSE